MTDFIMLSSFVRGLFSLWAILICMGYIADAVFSVSIFRIKHALCSLALFLMPYGMHLICSAISSDDLPGTLSVIAHLPHFVYFVILGIMSLLVIGRFIRNFRYGKTHITPKSIKQAADDLPIGFVYYLSDGQIYFLNQKMNDISVDLFCHPLLNGVRFENEIGEQKIFEVSDGTVYRFTKNMLNYKGNSMCEIVAEDVTELYRKNESLRVDNEALREYNRRMREYGEQIDETVRQEEILKAKVHIHDEMNRILLTIGNALSCDTEEERQRVLKLLKTNALLLCMEADDKDETPLDDLFELAKSIGITIHFENRPSLSGMALRTFVLTAQECMINAVKHAEAKNFYITVTENQSAVTAVFTNDGKAPEGKIAESGGLTHMRRRIERQGGKMTVETKPQFTLTAVILKEEPRNEL